jgi:hypothetical protein
MNATNIEISRAVLFIKMLSDSGNSLRLLWYNLYVIIATNMLALQNSLFRSLVLLNSQEISHILWNTHVQYYIHWSLS